MTDVGEVVRPGVNELQHVVPAACVRDMQPYWAHAQVELRHRVDGVVVDGDEGVLRSGQTPGV